MAAPVSKAWPEVYRKCDADQGNAAADHSESGVMLVLGSGVMAVWSAVGELPSTKKLDSASWGQ